MKKKILLIALLAIFGFALTSSAQTYCSPTFSSGCTSWNNQTITLDSIQWTLGSTACALFDYTNLHTTLQKGVAMPMTVTNGSWCGSGVWIDFNSDGTFDDTENIYYKYLAAATQTYTFDIIVPATVVNGTYRMRVVAGWGTDCFTSSPNGYGACGSYTYGNFDDFKVKVIDPITSINESQSPEITGLIIVPNPVSSELSVKVNSGLINSNYTLTDQFGKIVKQGQLNSENSIIDVSALAAGMYLFYTGNDQKLVYKVIKK
jgi:hypothetical protein